MDQKSTAIAAGTRTTIAYGPQPRASSALDSGIKTGYIYGLYPVLLPKVRKKKESCSHGLKGTMRRAKCMI